MARTFDQLSQAEQDTALGLLLQALGVDADLLADPTLGPLLRAAVRRRATGRVVFLDPGERAIRLPTAAPTFTT